MSIVAERYGLCQEIREVYPALITLRNLLTTICLHCEPTHGDHVLCYRRPRRAQAGTIGQLQVHI